MLQHIPSNDILIAFWHGLVHQKSCLSNMLNFLNELTGIMREGNGVDVWFGEKCNRVNHKPLADLCFREDCINGLRSILRKRMLRVKVEGELSEWTTIPSGVPHNLVHR